MKKLFIILVATTLFACGAQKGTTNIDGNGFIAEGYDVTEYFNGKAFEGSNAFIATYEGANYRFTSEANKTKFEAAPSKYAPQYGGFCAYAVGADNKKIGINPESYEIRDGKLYLFYDTVFADTKEKWMEEGAERLQKKADENWMVLKQQ
ncbi:YHS domain-containing (seleno)protein [Cochleicola gelatinilyticus]|uniref:YHS domain-containing protein n=1 Tax=Cochleicola gelatinilyticus TaxID=1763537 RepID=A0A167EN98_9FLAO|nr:YHS domain-containing (seleno)protein [Cochleicola gelatinilyticus]OAB75707.1 hypothetical protein ULVI_14620 [Cochleicola gelatinilyticus]